MFWTRSKCLQHNVNRITWSFSTDGVSTQLHSSGLVAHENSTFRNLALVVSVPFMAYMGALFDYKCAYD